MNRVQLKFLQDAEDQQELLSEFELEFIDSLMNKSENYELSDKQNAILNRISQKVNRGY